MVVPAIDNATANTTLESIMGHKLDLKKLKRSITGLFSSPLDLGFICGEGFFVVDFFVDFFVVRNDRDEKIE